MVQGQPPPPSPPAGQQQRGGRQMEPWMLWLLGGVGAALVVLLVVSLTGGDKEPGDSTVDAGSSSTSEAVATSSTTTTTSTTVPSPTTTSLGPGETPGEVFLETAGSNGPDPFTGEIFAAPVVTTTAPIVTMPQPPSTTTTTSATGDTGPPPAVISALAGDMPGLYGGTNNQAECDKAGMLAFLQANPDKAAAWVEAQNADPTLEWDDGRTSLTVADLPAFFAELTPVRLLYDTRVTNHGFRNGRPTPRQSVLQAGTAVLVDKWGVPRARCACGNPLIPPIPAPVPPTWVGPPWPGWDPTVIIVIDQSITIIENIVIIDINTGEEISRPTGTSGEGDTIIIIDVGPPLTVPPDVILGTGDIQITLIWAHDSDLDLHVIDPTGFEIYYSDSTAPSGGFLDVDAIPDQGDTSTHVENVFWPGAGGAPPGAYTVFVHHYASYTGAAGSYTLEVKVGGQGIYTETGSIAEDAESEPYTFNIEGGPGGSFTVAIDWAIANGFPVEDPAICDAAEVPGTYCIAYVADLDPGERVYGVYPQGIAGADVFWLRLFSDAGGWVVAETSQGGAAPPW